MKAERPKFTWKDHLRGMWSMFAYNQELNLRMRIKKLNSHGFGDENGMVQALKHELKHVMERKGGKVGS